MTITVTHAGASWQNATPAALEAAGVPASAIGAALKDRGVARLALAAQNARRAIEPDASRFAEYVVKLEVARDPASAAAAERAALDREAAARAMTPAANLADILATSAAWRLAILTIAAVEKEGRAAIAAVADAAPDVEAAVEAAVAAAEADLGAALAALSQGA